MNHSRKITLIFTLMLLFSLASKAQDYADSSKVKKENPTVILKLRDGTRLKGKIIQNDGKNYTIQTDNLGTLNVPAINVISTEQVSSSGNSALNGQLLEPLRNTDYLLSPNGFNLKQGEWRYSNTYLYYNNFGYGITDNFSANVGFIPIVSILTFSGKISFDATPNLHIAFNGNYISSVSNFTNVSAGTLGAVATLGTNSKNISFGATLGTGKGGNFTNRPIIQISGMTRISNKVALTMDNFLTSENRTTYTGSPYYISSNSSVIYGVLTYGIRVLWTRSQFDLGLISTLNGNTNSYTPTGIPYFKFTTSLSKIR